MSGPVCVLRVLLSLQLVIKVVTDNIILLTFSFPHFRDCGKNESALALSSPVVSNGYT